MDDGVKAGELERVWEASGITGAAAVRLSNGDTWVGAPEEGQDEPYVIYSVSKTFIAIAVLCAVNQGLCQLDDPVTRYLPLDVPRQVTIRRLLCHTSGVPDYGRLPEYHEAVRARPGRPWTDQETLERTLQEGLDFEPGERFAYSNVGYMLLRQLLDRTVPGGIRGALSEIIIEPLALTGTKLLESPEDLLSLPPGQTQLLGGGISDVRGVYHPHWVKHYTLASTVRDLLRFSSVLDGSALLSRERVHDMFTGIDVPAQGQGWERPGYGLGVMIDRRGNAGDVIVGHGGHGPGYGAALFQKQIPGSAPVTAAVLSGRDGGQDVERVTLALLDIASPSG